MKNFIPIFFVLLFATACHSTKTMKPKIVWYQTEKTYQDSQRDLAQCRLLANGAVPAGNNIFVPGPGANGVFLAQALAQNGQRNDIIRDCMIAKGYQQISTTSVPTNYFILSSETNDNSPKVSIKIEAFQKFENLTNKTFCVVPANTNDNDNVEFQTYADALSEGLESHGLIKSNINCDLLFFLRYKQVHQENLPYPFREYSVRIDVDDREKLETQSPSSLAQITIFVGSYADLSSSDGYLLCLDEFKKDFPFSPNPFHREITEAFKKP